MHWARCLSRRTEKGRAYGVVTAKSLAVLEALLWAFHNAKIGLCFPSYETIAEAAGCARSTVAEAIKALEDAGVLSWVNRIKRVREQCSDLLGADGASELTGGSQKLGGSAQSPSMTERRGTYAIRTRPARRFHHDCAGLSAASQLLRAACEFDGDGQALGSRDGR